LIIDESCEVDLERTRRLIVVGAGKASAAMAASLDQLLRQALPKNAGPEITGWINAPHGTFSRQIPGIQLLDARPTGANTPTAAAVNGTKEILRLVSEAQPEDVVICLLSGGGSALLVAPQPGITLEDKQNVASWIARAGGDIRQLNAVRRCLSQVKGGGLARACNAARLICLIISDVLGDPLDVIASGPTCLDRPGDPEEALAILEELGLSSTAELQPVVHWLQKFRARPHQSSGPAHVENIVLGNNSDAVDAAGVRAVQLGYRYHLQTVRQAEGDVQAVANQACRAIELLRTEENLDCWISGGEPTVKLPSGTTGRGGRNQHLSLCVLRNLISRGWPDRWPDCEIVFLSGGTDGEDGPTDAAGAIIDRSVVARMRQMGLDPNAFLERADSYHFFQKAGGLIHSGPTGTNVCDLRVGLCSSTVPQSNAKSRAVDSQP
jgi:glycerate 2-kinase